MSWHLQKKCVLKRWRNCFFVVVIIYLTAYGLTALAADTYSTAKHESKYPEYPVINYGEGPQAALIKRGEYLAKAGDCIACHTDGPSSKPFAGGLPIHTPFGTIYSPNITPDKETGIGKWTDEQFIRAMREGISPHGQYYFPVFPYPNFNKLSREDTLAIKAYLDALPPVHQENRPVDMPIPFRWRWGQFFWRVMFFDFDHHGFKPDTHRSPEWNKGAYLVQGLGHCGMCHTPMNFLGAPKKEYDLTGGFVEGFYAPNISSTNLKGTPIQQVVDVFLKDKLIGGGDVQGPMLEVNHDSLMYLNREDLDNIVVYLQTVKSKIPPQPKRSVKVDLKVGEKIYNQYCQGCHSTGAGGAPKMGDKADWAPRIQLGLNELYKNAITGIGGMPPKGACATCSTVDMQSAVDYIVLQSGGKVPNIQGGISETPTVSPTAIARGKIIYERSCAVCHDGGQPGTPKVGDQKVWGPLIQQGMDVLITRSIKGYRNMPAKGGCAQCSDADVIAAVKYMVEQGRTSGNYDLW